MAEEIRIQRGDSRVIEFEPYDYCSDERMTDLTDYEVIFTTENFERTSEIHPLLVKKDVDGDGEPIILIYIQSTDTDPIQPRLHYDLKLYKPGTPYVFYSGSSGDLIITDEQ